MFDNEEAFASFANINAVKLFYPWHLSFGGSKQLHVKNAFLHRDLEEVHGDSNRIGLHQWREQGMLIEDGLLWA